MPEFPNEFPDGEIFLPPATPAPSADEALPPSLSFFQKLKPVHWLVLGGVVLVLISEFVRHNAKGWEIDGYFWYALHITTDWLSQIFQLIGFGTLIWVIGKSLSQAINPPPEGKTGPNFGLPTTWGHYLLLAAGMTFASDWVRAFTVRLLEMLHIELSFWSSPVHPYDYQGIQQAYYVQQSLVMGVLLIGLYRGLSQWEPTWRYFAIMQFAYVASRYGRRTQEVWVPSTLQTWSEVFPVVGHWVTALLLLAAIGLLAKAISADLQGKVQRDILHKLGLASWLVVALPSSVFVVRQLLDMILPRV